MLAIEAPHELSDDFELPLRLSAAHAELNDGATVFGGWLLAQADLATSIMAYAHIKGPFVTKSVKHFDFIRPAYKTDLISFYCRLSQQGRTSVTFDVVLYSQRSHEFERHHKIATGEFIFVSIDEKFKPSPINKSG